MERKTFTMMPGLIGLCAVLIGIPQATPPDTLTASGAERIFERQEQKFTIARQGEKTLLRTNRNVNNALAGEERLELSTPEGSFTWLTAQPAWTLHLLTVSSEQSRFLDPPRFHINDLRTNLPTVERALGGKVTLGRRENFGNRSCITLVVTYPRTGRQQGFWLDTETGLILRHVDMVNGLKDYERWFTQFDSKASLPASTFQLPTDTRVIHGIADAGILRYAARPRGKDAYREDLNQIRQKSALGAGSWLNILPTIPGFEYTHTVHNERIGTFSKEALARRASMNQGIFSAIPVLSNIPVIGKFFSNEQESAEVSFDNLVTVAPTGNAQIALTLSDKVRINTIPGELAQGIRVFTSDTLPSDLLTTTLSLRLSPTLDAATRKKLFEEEKQVGADSMVQSDFLDPKTGDTVSFLQLRHRGIASLFPGLELPAPGALPSKTLGRVQTYTLAKPFTLYLITWQNEGGVYVLASSRLTPKELLALAEQAER